MVARILIGVVVLIHAYIVVLEMLLWDTPRGRKAFGMTAEFSALSKVLAANQGLYNGFLVAGLVWGLWLGEAGFAIKVFFLGCVVVAGRCHGEPQDIVYSGGAGGAGAGGVVGGRLISSASL